MQGMSVVSHPDQGEQHIEGVRLTAGDRLSKVTRIALGAWDKDEHGVISSWNDNYVFVLYSRGGTASATLAEELRWGWLRGAA
jgi:hypothetical protein